MDWYMFTPEEHEYLRFLETGVAPTRFEQKWRVYGEKINEKKNIRRRYYKCTSLAECAGRRVEIYDLITGELIENCQYSNCSHHQQKKVDL